MILFVCAGNTCRSPLAEVIANARDISAASAGLYALPGKPASMGAMIEAETRGLSLRSHRSKQVSQELLDKADIVYAMSDELAEAMTQAFPESKGKIKAISPNIPDPYGMDFMYPIVADNLEEFIHCLQQRGISGVNNQ